MIRSVVLTQITGVTSNSDGPDSDGPGFDGSPLPQSFPNLRALAMFMCVDVSCRSW